MLKFEGFDWDDGNWPKCAKHGLSKTAIEWMLSNTITVFDDTHDPDIEKRYRAIGKDEDGKHIFIVFCIREKDGGNLLRPISARYMHKKEIEHYEQEEK